MATFTVNIPVWLKKRLDKHPDINWSEYLKGRFEIKVKQLRKFEAMVKNGEL
ncbi:MAG: hypothetical protein U9Q69_05295 [Nanoarchaeota archaeon]|nr:hypothetical protein [Nanoarchaeota archaeon]